MKIIDILLIFGVFGSVFGAARISRVEIEENENPIIGVLAEEIEFNYLNTQYPGKYKSFIAASYVKFVEGGGARVVPIWWVHFFKPLINWLYATQGNKSIFFYDIINCNGQLQSLTWCMYMVFVD